MGLAAYGVEKGEGLVVQRRESRKREEGLDHHGREDRSSAIRQ